MKSSTRSQSSISFFVPGIPVGQGSKRAFVQRGKAILVESGGERHKDWRAAVRLAAYQAMQGAPPFECPVSVYVTFYFPRPKSHFGSGKNAAILRGSAPAVCAKPPDADKLIRAVFDSLTGVAFKDDALVCGGSFSKQYSNNPGAYITVNADISKRHDMEEE